MQINRGNNFTTAYATYTDQENGKLQPETKRMWVSALRSGNYPQTLGRLKRGDAYCCLGVLCEIDPMVHYLPEGYLYEGGNSSGTLPSNYANYLGISTEGRFHYTFSVAGVTYVDYTSLVVLNDDLKLNFKQIADVINYFF